jgi:hypothetical protein
MQQESRPSSTVLRAELESFEYEYVRRRRVLQRAEGMHDDSVYALALARSLYREKGLHRAASSWGGGTTTPVNPDWQ